MDNNTFKNFPPAIEIVGGTIEVTGHLDGRSLISSLWRTLSASSLTQDGDHFMGQSHGLLQRHLKLMPLEDQNVIRESLDLLVSGIYIAHQSVKIKSDITGQEKGETMWKTKVASPNSERTLRPGTINVTLGRRSNSSG
jgi:hypothetical protein